MNMPISKHATRMTVLRLTMTETGTYNVMFNRPYSTNVTGQTLSDLTSRLEHAHASHVTGSLLAGSVNNILQPTATPEGQVNISNGWAERRIRFVLVVKVEFTVGTDTIYYFQGYTSHPGVSMNGHIDPTMEFFINSYVGVKENMLWTPSGYVSSQVVTESNHVLADNNWSGAYYQDQKNMMRPMDILRGMQTVHLHNSYDFDRGGMMDTRYMLKNEASHSKRSNNLPTTYVANLIDDYQYGAGLASFGQGAENIISEAIHHSLEDPTSSNAFIRAISDERGLGLTNRFTHDTLCRIDPNVVNVTDFAVMGQTQRNTNHQAGSTSYWNGSDRDTLAATILSNAVPALMMDLMITNVVFRSTNHDIGGMVNTTMISAKGMTSADMTRNYEMFKARLEREVLFDLTYGNQELFMLEMRVDLFGETWIKLSLGSNPPTDFVTPSFCDNLFVPVITGNKDNFSNVVHDFEQIVRTSNEVLSGSGSAVIHSNV